MRLNKIFCFITLLIFAITIVGCGGAEVKVKNSSSFPIREVSIGDVSFSEVINPGSGTEYKEIEEGSYNPTFWAYSYYLESWLGYRAAETLKIEEGGFLSGDEEYTWTVSDSTLVEPL